MCPNQKDRWGKLWSQETDSRTRAAVRLLWICSPEMCTISRRCRTTEMRPTPTIQSKRSSNRSCKSNISKDFSEPNQEAPLAFLGSKKKKKKKLGLLNVEIESGCCVNTDTTARRRVIKIYCIRIALHGLGLSKINAIWKHKLSKVKTFSLLGRFARTRSKNNNKGLSCRNQDVRWPPVYYVQHSVQYRNSLISFRFAQTAQSKYVRRVTTKNLRGVLVICPEIVS